MESRSLVSGADAQWHLAIFEDCDCLGEITCMKVILFVIVSFLSVKTLSMFVTHFSSLLFITTPSYS